MAQHRNSIQARAKKASYMSREWDQTDKDKGKLEIEFYGSDAFEALYTLLMKQQ